LNRFWIPHFWIQHCATGHVHCHSGCAISSTVRCCFRMTHSGATMFFVKMWTAHWSGCEY